MFQKLYKELESTLPLSKEAQVEKMIDSFVGSNVGSDGSVAKISYIGQGRQYQAVDGRTAQLKKPKSPLEIKGYF